MRCRAEDALDVKKALRAEILYRGNFSPWDESIEGEWFDVSTDQTPLAWSIFAAAKPWLVACYDGQRWLVPTPEGWRERT